MFNPVIKYLYSNKILAALAFYFLFSSILKAIADIDICIPCLWKSMFGVKCPGCGLTTAFISLIGLDYSKAFENNWLIFLIAPLGIYYITKDYSKFKRKQLA